MTQPLQEADSKVGSVKLEVMARLRACGAWPCKRGYGKSENLILARLNRKCTSVRSELIRIALEKAGGKCYACSENED